MHIYRKEEQTDTETKEFMEWETQNLNFTFYELEPKSVRDHVNISYELNTEGYLQILIRDFKNGKENIIVNTHQTKGFYKLRHKTLNLEPGFYTIKMIFNDTLEEKEMIIIK